ncbi:hypothetical protein A1Q2_00209 [Trichosporon asahii var. asahii CBS 8904]|uniref:CFEM domain-containing protein n=1 Tax=Trichosporon asahii var. asahii (strain CBS 8904) TaxID=1220162 RepID=K1W9H5_TRIAC|nr:hypothetical protein A1Q2_00209 [Trichosporon asahii var. asahii CBS 8904]
MASDCLQAKCQAADIVSSLNLQREMCPDLGLPDLGALPSCPLGCVLETLKKKECSGPLDKNCICKLNFSTSTMGCLMKKCKFKGLKESLELQIDQCRGSSDVCEATGIWRVTNIRCWFQKRGYYEEQILARRGTPAAHMLRTVAFLETETPSKQHDEDSKLCAAESNTNSPVLKLTNQTCRPTPSATANPPPA